MRRDYGVMRSHGSLQKGKSPHRLRWATLDIKDELAGEKGRPQESKGRGGGGCAPGISPV